MEQALYQAAITTFEELGFMFPVERLNDNEFNAGASVRVAVRFSGTFSGQIVLQMENEILPMIAANMLDSDDDEIFADEILHDILGEFANVICGNALPVIAGKQEIFHLDAPRILNESTTDAPTAIARLDVEESKADVMLYIN